MINFEWYRTFKAIYQTGTLTGAAQELLISQPNVSQHLSSLESYIGQLLFERKPRKMVPTDYGKLFYTQIIEAVEKLENVETHFRHDCLSKRLPLTSIGAPKEFFTAMLAPHVSQLPAPIVAEFGVTKDLVPRLTKGELHFLISTKQLELPNIIYEPAMHEKFLLVANAGLNTMEFEQHLDNGELDKAEEWLLMQNWFAYSSDLMIIRRFWLENFRKRPSVKPQFIIPDFDAIISSLSHGEGVSIVADYLVKDLLAQGLLKELWPGIATTGNTLYLAYDKTKVTTTQLDMMRYWLQLSVLTIA